MEYFAGLDVSMEETHVIVVNRDSAGRRVGRGGSRSCPGREFRTRRRKPVRRVLDRIEAVSPILVAGR
jgi:hypothetical protein